MQIVVDKRNSHLLVFNRDASEADDASQVFVSLPFSVSFLKYDSAVLPVS